MFLWNWKEKIVGKKGVFDVVLGEKGQAVCLVCFLIKNQACFFQDKAIIMRV